MDLRACKWIYSGTQVIPIRKSRFVYHVRVIRCKGQDHLYYVIAVKHALYAYSIRRPLLPSSTWPIFNFAVAALKRQRDVKSCWAGYNTRRKQILRAPDQFLSISPLEKNVMSRLIATYTAMVPTHISPAECQLLVMHKSICSGEPNLLQYLRVKRTGPQFSRNGIKTRGLNGRLLRWCPWQHQKCVVHPQSVI